MIASTRHDLGWTAEFVTPFHVLRFTSEPVKNWSINFGRRIQRDREETYWVPLSRRDGRQALYLFGKGGRLVGLQNIKPGGRLQVLPFSVLGAEGARFNSITPVPSSPIAGTGFDTDIQRKIGGDPPRWRRMTRWSTCPVLHFSSAKNVHFSWNAVIFSVSPVVGETSIGAAAVRPRFSSAAVSAVSCRTDPVYPSIWECV